MYCKPTCGDNQNMHTKLQQINDLLPDNKFESKDYNAGDVVERVRWLLDMHEALSFRENLAWEMLDNGNVKTVEL
jgi:hypothetical protein